MCAAAATQSGLTQQQRTQIWALADVNSDGQLNAAEFAICYHIIRQIMFNDLPLPKVLPPVLRPRGLPENRVYAMVDVTGTA
jgi:Cytoskeletal-regulatory complex EF hand